MTTPVPPSLVEAFCAAGTVDVDYSVIPVPSQIGVSPEIASFDTGFPPATRTARTSGGIPPRGKDMNGVLRMATAHNAWVAAGNFYTFNQDVVDVAGGYRLGAILISATSKTRFYQSMVDGNTNDPDSVLTGWKAFSLSSLAADTSAQTPAAGSVTVAVPDGAGFVDLTPSAGATTVTNFTGGSVGDIITVSNLHASNPLTIQANANIRMAGDLTLVQNNSLSFRKRTTTQWVAMS
jgi:hypothetical protein